MRRDEWAYVGCTPAYLTLSPQRVFARSLHPPGPASLCGCERSALIRWKQWRRDELQPVIGSFRCGGAVGLVPRSRHLAFCAAQRIQPRHGQPRLGLPQRNRPVATWMNGSCQGAARPLVNELCLRSQRSSSQRSTTRSPNLGLHPTCPAYLSLLPPPLLQSMARKEKGYNILPPLDESVAACFCPPLARRQKPPTRPNRLERLSALAGQTYSSAGQASNPSPNSTRNLSTSCPVRLTWPCAPPRWQLRWSADPRPV